MKISDITSKRPLVCFALSTHPWHSLQGADVRRKSNLDLGNAEARVFRAQPYVASAHEVHRTADTSPVYRGDYGLRASLHRGERCLQREWCQNRKENEVG